MLSQDADSITVYAKRDKDSALISVSSDCFPMSYLSFESFCISNYDELV